MMDIAYSTFVGGVAANRKLSLGSVQAAAQGRAWSGRDALRLGLIDRLGGLQDAIQLACQEAGLPEVTAVQMLALVLCAVCCLLVSLT